MKRIIYLLQMSLFFSFSPLVVHAVEIKTPLDAVQALGHEMSEMRHMLETYAMIGAGVSFKLPREQLKASMSLYEEVISQMEKQFADKEIQEQITVSHTSWAPVKKALETALQKCQPSPKEMKEEAIFIHGNIRSVIKALEAMKSYMLTKTAFKAIGELDAAIEIDASARRLSAHYAMWMWDLDDPTIEQHWQKGMNIYAHSVAVLEKSTFAQKERFGKMLAKVKKQLEIFEMMHAAASRELFTPALIQVRAQKTSETAMKMMAMILHQE